MARWTITFLEHTIGPTYIFVSSNTSKPGHLTVTWSYIRPARDIIYRTVRGKLIRCGYRYTWTTPHLVEQQEEGDTMIHGFLLEGLIPESTIFYYQHEPQPPSEWECQGSLHILHTLRVAPPGTYLYFASRLLGMFMTTSFSPPNGGDPRWVPDNEGLLSLEISQAALDPVTPQHLRYVIAGGHLYRHFNEVDFGPANSITILTWPEALALTGCTDGTILWVQPNRRHPGMLHVLWSGFPAPCSFWHLRSLDYGEHWTAHQIAANTFTTSAGNIQAGFDKGTSPHGEGDVVYAAINLGMIDTPSLARSLDQGATWTTMDAGDTGRTTFRPRIHVDPSNQAVIYIGCHPAYPKIYRSEDHGDTWDQVDRGHAITLCLNHPTYHSTLRSHYSNPNLVRQLHNFFVEKSVDYCESWQRQPAMIEPTCTFRFTNDNPNLLYLGRITSGTPPPPFLNPHVIFVTEDEGLIIHGKAGANCHLPDGGGDSIPYTCGGAAADGILIVSSP